MRYAVFDLGSNSIKFVVAETSAGRVRILREKSIPTRLAEHLIDTCELRPEAIERTLTALRQLRAEATELKVEHFRAVATSAVRDSRNRKEFLRAAREVLGFPVRLLSGDVEADTIFAGVTAEAHWKGKDLFILDIGGGSAEWVQGHRGNMEKRISLPLGVPGLVSASERFLHQYPVAPDNRRAAGRDDSRGNSSIHWLIMCSVLVALVGTGGTITCLAAIEKELHEFDPHKIDHASLTLAQVRDLMNRFTGKTLDQLRAIPGLPAKRADLIIPGTAVALATMELLGAKRLGVSVRGLRYGVLTAAIHDVEPRAGSPTRRDHHAKSHH